MEKLYTLEELLTAEEADEIIGHLYDDEVKVVEAILELKINWKYDHDKKEYFYTLDDLQEAVDMMDDVTYFMDWDDYYDYCDDLLDFHNPDSVEARYFDYDAYHNDCGYDVTEAANGVILGDW